MDTLSSLVRDFWVWTKLPSTKWNKIDISKLPVPVEEFPELSSMQTCCIRKINTHLTEDELDNFLLCMAVDNEDEEILDACRDVGTNEFIADIIQAGVNHPQPMTRWQMAELLRRDIPNRENYLIQLCCDANAYVEKRAENVLKLAL